MRATKVFLMVFIILSLGAAVNGEKMTYITTLSATSMPSIDMANKPLEKVLDELHTKVPDFHFVIFRAPNVAADYPVLPAMKLENVHIDQFLTLIDDEFPSVDIRYNIDNNGNGPPLIEVNIKGDPTTGQSDQVDQSPAAIHLRQQIAESNIKLRYEKADVASKAADLKRKQDLLSSHGASQSEVQEAELAVQLAQAQADMVQLDHDSASAELGKAKASSDPLTVRVFGLHDLISARMVLFQNKNLTEKQATDDILSLVIAAQEQVESSKLPVVKVHQPTQTLIFKGTAEQAALLDQSLNALANDQNRVNDSYSQRMDDLTAENAQLRVKLGMPKRSTSHPWG